ncbi:MAG: hypothetical protein ABIG63_17720 [Chloroflexota bacterium]
MTCIVGLVTEKKVYMGSDSAGSDGFTYSIRQEPKVFRRPGDRGEMIIGYTTSFRFGQLLEHALEVPIQPKNMDDHKYMVTSFMNAIRKCLKDGGHITKKDEVERGGTALIGYHGKLWQMERDLQIALSPTMGDAIGSGVYAAMGALHILSGLALAPEKKIKRALEVAEACVTTVKGPFKIISGATP